MRQLALSIVTAVMATSAFAAEATISGTYGNEAGCAYLKSGDYGDDSIVYLTAEQFSTYGQSCHFVGLRPLPESFIGYSVDLLADSICFYEGEDIRGAEQLVLSPDMDGTSYRIFSADTSLRAELDKCPE